MATLMVYGMIVYNVALGMDGVTNKTFLIALHELPIMMPIAFFLEFFAVGRIAKAITFSYMRPDDRPMFIILSISSCICMVMCPIMSLIAMLLFNDTKSFGMWIQMWAMNLPMALLYQLLYCGPLARFIFRMVFPQRA